MTTLMTPFRRLLILAVLSLISLSAMVGCEKKVTVENYDKIQVGWTKTQVENLLGSGTDETASGTSISGAGIPDTKAAAEKTYVWRDGGLTITLVFKDGKVVQKEKVGG